LDFRSKETAVSIITVLEMHFAPETVDDASRRLGEIVSETRQFDGCLRIEVVRSPEDAGHFLLWEEWESLEHDQAYRAWRQGAGKTNLRTFADRPNVTTFWDPTEL
jgi:quinol monooxygenase YgiN